MAYTPYDPEAGEGSEDFKLGFRLGALEVENELLRKINEKLREDLNEALRLLSASRFMPPKRYKSDSEWADLLNKVKAAKNVD